MGVNNANLLESIRVTKRNITLSSEAITTAQTAFTTHYNEFMVLAEQLEVKFNELEVREGAVEIKEKQMKAQEDQLQAREQKCIEREQHIEKREKEVPIQEERWREIEKRMQSNAAKLPHVIHMNVCGTRFSVSKEKLLQWKGSLLEQMMVSDHSQQLSATGEMFIERDPKYFKHVVRFLLNGTQPTSSSAQERLAIEQEFAYFSIPFKLPELGIFMHPANKKNELVDDNLHGGKLKEWIPNQKFQLIYKATVDGFAAADFHKHCDNKEPTLTVIRSSNGHLFGGYSILPWDSTSGYKNHAEGFIFTLTNPHNIPPTKYSRNPNNQQAIYCHPNYGPTFGNGHDIYVAGNSHQNTNSYTNFTGVNSYIDTTGKGTNTFTGIYNFTTNEIEVFVVL